MATRFLTPFGMFAAVFLCHAAAGAENGETIDVDVGVHLVWTMEKSGPYDILGRIDVFLNGEKTQTINHDVENPDIIVGDYNFDGHMDFSCFSTSGAATGFRAVFLFDPGKREFIQSETMSNLPCIDVDAEKKLVTGTCFHGSACENWQESYTVSGHDTLQPVRRWGTECGPASEDYYYVFETRYRNGEIIFDQRTQHPFDTPR